MSRQGTRCDLTTRAEAADHGVQDLFDYKSVRWQQLILLGSWHAGGGARAVSEVARCYSCNPSHDIVIQTSQLRSAWTCSPAEIILKGRSLQNNLRTISLSTSLRLESKGQDVIVVPEPVPPECRREVARDRATAML